MCGIAGIISCSRQFNIGHLKQMTDAIAHRGPDGEGHWHDENEGVFLGHRRLSIIDLTEQGAQPMHFLNRYVIIHNGEVYNYKEIRAFLETKGYQFRSTTDTEVIVAAYDHYQTACLDHFEGMFAFAIWDKREKQLFIARDRMGEKPLYYYINKITGDFFFASELKAFWSIGLPKQISEEMLIAYLGLGITGHPSDRTRTFYKDYFQLEPGHYSIIKLPVVKDFRSSVYWKCPMENNSVLSDKEVITRFRVLFETSVSNRLRSDVKIGTSLSGGLDSSSVVEAIHQHRGASAHYSYQTFTAVFPGFEKNEHKQSEEITKQFGLKQRFVYPSADDFANDLPGFISIHEEPISSASVYAQFKVYQSASGEGVKVLLDGQGADELLGGYDKYQHWFLQGLLASGNISRFLQEKRLLSENKSRLPWGWRNYLAAMLPARASAQLEVVANNKIFGANDFNKDYLIAHFTKGIVKKPIIKNLNELLFYNSFTYGLSELLRYADKNSMACSCEVRLPFLNFPLVEFVFSLGSEYKIRDGLSKWLLRMSMKDSLPADIVLRRDKIGFEPPQELWMKHQAVDDLIRHGKENLVKMGILSNSAMQKKTQPHSSYAADGTDWRYLSAGLLLQ